MPTLRSKELEKLRVFLEKIDDTTRTVTICDINNSIFNIDLGGKYKAFAINLLEEAVQYVRNKNKNISWSIDGGLVYSQNDKLYFYEESFWKLIANGDCLILKLDININYEQLLQLINEVQLQLIHFDGCLYEDTERNMEIFRLIKEVSRARVTYISHALLYEI